MAKVKLSPTAIVREAKRIKTTPSVLAVRSLKFKGKPDCERLVRFIKSSGEELSKISIPSKRDAKKLLGGGIGGGVAGIDPLGTALTTMMYPKQMATGVGISGLVGLGGIGLMDLLTGRKMSKGIMKGVKGVGSKISNAGKGIKNFFGKGGGVADDLAEATVKQTSKKIATKVVQKGAKSTVSKGLGALPLIGNLWDLGSAAYRFKKGDTVGGLLSLGSAIPIAGWGFAALDIARDTGAFEGTPLKNKEEEGKEEKQEEKEVKKSTKETKGSDASKVINKFDSTVNKFSLKGKTLNVVSKATKFFGFNRGGKVPGSGNRDTVPAMLTPGEVVISKPAVDKIGAGNLLAMNAAGGGTNKPTVSGGFNKGGMVPEGASGYTGEEKEQQEAYMLKFLNQERDLQGLKPLKNLSYAEGVYLTKMRGPGPRTKEESDTHHDFDNMIKSTSKSKTVDGKTSFSSSMSQLTEEDREEELAANPLARKAVNLKQQIGLDNLGADISASAKMNGGGLVQGFNGGGLVAQVAPTPIKLTKQNSSVGMVESETIIINRIPDPQPQSQQGGGTQIIPVPMGGGGKGQVSPPMPSTYEVVNSIRISSLLTKLSIT